MSPFKLKHINCLPLLAIDTSSVRNRDLCKMVQSVTFYDGIVVGYYPFCLTATRFQVQKIWPGSVLCGGRMCLGSIKELPLHPIGKRSLRIGKLATLESVNGCLHMLVLPCPECALLVTKRKLRQVSPSPSVPLTLKECQTIQLCRLWFRKKR